MNAVLDGWEVISLHPLAFYLSRKSDTHEVCVEPLVFEGFDVALYDLRKNLVLSKKLRFGAAQFDEALAKAMELLEGADG